MSNLEGGAVESWSYREMGRLATIVPRESVEAKTTLPPPPPGISEADALLRVQIAVNEAEKRWALEAEKLDAQKSARLTAVIEAFSAQRSRYFRDVESEVVQLALAVARKILEREAALDPTLLRGLVRIALDRVGAEGKVRVRLSPEQFLGWSKGGVDSSASHGYELIADPALSPSDCIIETDRGSVNCGIEEQLKGIEQSFCDLLAKRPETAG